MSRRLAIALVLLAATAGLAVVDAATSDQRRGYPSDEQIVTDYDGVVGEQAFVIGPVESVGETAATIRLRHLEAERTLRVTGIDRSLDVRPGGTIQVLGRLDPENRLVAERVVVVNRTAHAEGRKWALSLLAVAGFLGLFVRHWRVVLPELQVEVRTDG